MLSVQHSILHSRDLPPHLAACCAQPQCYSNGLHLNCITEALKIVIKVIYIPIHVTGYLYQADQISEDCIP